MNSTPRRCATAGTLEDSIPFSLHRDEEGLDELKGQNWELPLQDGEGLWTGGSLP